MVTLGRAGRQPWAFSRPICARRAAGRSWRSWRSEGIRALMLPEEATRNGAVESLAEEARQYAEFFRSASGLNWTACWSRFPTSATSGRSRIRSALGGDRTCPVLVHAFPDQPDRMSIQYRRGQLSAARFRSATTCTSTASATRCRPADTRRIPHSSEAFRAELRRFAGVCRVVRVRCAGCRIGQIGARPAAFNTVRYSEKAARAGRASPSSRWTFRSCWGGSGA
ncbi:MAG: hypothetical protein KatS3mg115_0941 [Candidatus Poribacteria bacterium]|nr:MAG: hypothetical protein KatS3mg115_0941 [Candidatus Poribacteria bacterium]